MANVTTTVARPVAPEGQQAFFNWLFGMLTPNGSGGYSLYGADPYQGPLNVNMHNTELPALSAMFNTQPMGMAMLQSMWPNAGQPTDLQNMYRQNIEVMGGIGGLPTDFMLNAARGQQREGQAQQMLSNAAQFGAPSDPTRWALNNILGYGVAHPVAGGGLTQMAAGQGPALQFLAPFLQAPNYATPNIPGVR